MQKNVIDILKFLRPPYSLLSRRLFSLGAAAFLMGLFIKLSTELQQGEVDALDHRWLARIIQLRKDAWNGPAIDITALGSPTVLTLFIVVGLLIFVLKRHWREARYLVFGSLGIPLWTTGMKHLFTRPRPSVGEHLVDVTSYSYPSGHTVASTAFYLLIAVLVSRQFTALQARVAIYLLALGIISAIGLSRIYLGVHYPSDVLSGFFLGSSWVLTVTAILALHEKKRSLLTD